MPCYYPRAHLHSSWTSPCPPPLLRPGPPFLITIPLKWLLLSVNDHVPCPLSLRLYLEDSSASLSLGPSSVIATTTRASASNWTQSPPPWVRARGAWGQRTDLHLPPFFLDFLPMKCLILNYSHPTLIVIDWNSRGSGRMTDRLSSLQTCPPRRRAKRRRRLQRQGRRLGGREREISARQCKVTHEHYRVVSHAETRAAFKLPIVGH